MINKKSLQLAPRFPRTSWFHAYSCFELLFFVISAVESMQTLPSRVLLGLTRGYQEVQLCTLGQAQVEVNNIILNKANSILTCKSKMEKDVLSLRIKIMGKLHSFNTGGVLLDAESVTSFFLKKIISRFRHIYIYQSRIFWKKSPKVWLKPAQCQEKYEQNPQLWLKQILQMEALIESKIW